MREKPSSAARLFVKTAKPEPYGSLQDVDRLRAEEHEEALRNNVEIIDNFVSDLTHESIGGVDCLVITPQSYDDGNESRRAVFFFGGAYVFGSPDVDLPISARLASELGVKVVSPYYRRAPKHPYPAAIDDGYAVYTALLDEKKSMVLAGESAGGNLVLSLTLRARDAGIEMPAAIGLMSPWCDLTPARPSQQLEGFDPTLAYGAHTREPGNEWAGDIPLDDPAVSPIYADYGKGFVPTIISTGTREMFVDDCRELARVMEEGGNEVDLRVWPGLWHSFEWYHAIPESMESIQEYASFFTQRMN